ncbi:tRNA (guanine(37)-N1)-methyltransferase 1 [Cocos nucifera]|uniref:tRNA (guanine(37)-N1)-methyltransferase n=1 Tax=Cocos nucifera TaxID=13894 RepID=A0A8K0IBJ4_COCNU|nr:tRNA (guanine(37)-N1)-methyltransferase 1 [Cocos nucifera]
MFSFLALRPHSPLPLSFPSPHRLLPKPSPFSAFSASLTLTLDPDDRPIHYGPSLRRGRWPSPASPPSLSSGDGPLIDKASYARVFDVAALRVPAEECAALENRLRGHLLNWPRVRNVARVPGDDVEPEFKRIMRDAEGDGGDRLRSLARRVDGVSDGEEVVAPSQVMYREKLAKDFNWRGFVRFRNLAKISRPKKKKKKRDGERKGIEAKERMEKNGFSFLEVVEDGEEKDDMRGLLGAYFHVGRWRGPTRLLLLDERYANKDIDELPEAVKMNELLETLLPENMVVPTGFETVGHIAHLNLRDKHLPYKKLIAQVVLDKNKPKIQTVVNKIDAIQNDYRTMQLEVLAGNHSLVTTVVENGIRFQVDLATVLATERQRLVSGFASSDVVCDVFSGVGPIAIYAAKKVKHVYANDLNPIAVEYLERNIVLNKLDRKISVFNMEGRRFICAIFANQRPYPITQVVMNLPNDAAEFLDAFRGIFRKRRREKGCNLPKIHLYGFSKAQIPEYDFHQRINMALCETVADIEMHRVRLVAPGKWMLRASFTLPQTVALARQTGHF